ncbi:MAG: membrane-bound lytic murein transglycosylase F [Methylophagaceae bacterium]|jgi:membrane-bound lytic murein transglycosylase F
MFYKIFLIITCCLLAACSDEELPTPSKKNTNELVIVSRNAPTTWYIDKEGNQAGFEYDLAVSYAKFLGLEPRFVIKDTISELFTALEQGTADIAAAGLTVMPERSDRFLLGPKYHQVQQQVVCHRNGKNPKTIDDLLEVELTVVKDSSYSKRLNEVSKSKEAPLNWEETEQHSTEDLLELVYRQKLECTVADSNIIKINRRHFPALEITMNLTEKQDIALYLANDALELQQGLTTWHQEFNQNTEAKKIFDQHYAFWDEFDYVDVSVFKRRIHKRLPKYKKIFLEAAERYNLPAETLIAQSYQESHWEPDAVSPTGVKGMMMLTKPTARELNVDNRLDPEQSIAGGAHYLKNMMQRFKDDIPDDDKLMLALAAYNIGRGHMHDAQILAREKGLSPHHWHDMKQVLPLLSQKKYYKNLKYGYARGAEPVSYVQNIREYEHILLREMN